MTDYQISEVLRITKQVQQIYGVSLRELASSGKQTPSIARQMIWYKSRETLYLSYGKQKRVWNRDCKVIWRGIKSIQGEIKVNPVRRNEYLNLSNGS